MGFGWWKLFGAALVGILFFHGFCGAERAPDFSFMHNATTAPDISYYDYIIVGGGTAGCPLAATLSQNYSVLLLERGGTPYGNPNITNLSAFGRALSDLSPTSPSQRFISEDGVINARARVLGGGSCLNAGFYSRAATDYAREAGWDTRLVNESYQWVERLVAFRPPMQAWQSAVRDGLTVLLHATVHKILFRTKGKSRPLAHGVVFRDASGNKHRAYLKSGPKNEIIVSSGALGSPQLLMLSGVGPAEHLRAHNITVVVDQPLVGQGMSDNPMNAIFVPSPIPVEVSLIQVVGITHFGSYIEAASGENFAGSASTRDFGMFSPKIGQLSTVPPKQRTPEALAKAVEYMNSLEAPAFRGGFILEKVMGPISTGHLELRTRNPNDNPSVTFNYFKDPLDLERCIQGIETIEKIIESKPFSKFRYDYLSLAALLNMTANSPVNLLPKHANASRSLDQFCKDTVMSIWHYHGGCQVGRVVDNQHKVLGVDALRVIDGSTFIYSPGTNPQATVMMLGR
ncbi:protein HOTHEAD [Prunus yedoensis var. nudiflora]|uniref:Protein HOTHEAD n=1 Tax=Prunus yedoensis var. nudiflora TaxID=2094558 RepID=A0A314Z6F2_PRUYE|nr:protein HOTHEAD [Prunus yedoensis var. nudiflora]